MQQMEDIGDTLSFPSEREPDTVGLDEDVAGASMADLPEVIQCLQKQLLAGYTCYTSLSVVRLGRG
jgi:hypothetical protein